MFEGINLSSKVIKHEQISWRFPFYRVL